MSQALQHIGRDWPVRRPITEYLELDVEREMWCCRRCGTDLVSARENYKKGCLLHDRDPREIHLPFGDHPVNNFAPDPEWQRIIEFYCPSCGVMMDVEYLPPGHPITHDIELDLTAIRAKRAEE